MLLVEKLDTLYAIHREEEINQLPINYLILNHTLQYTHFKKFQVTHVLAILNISFIVMLTL